MDWFRAVLDGVMMSAYFNLATGLLMVIRPATFTTSYPKGIQKIAAPNPHVLRDKGLFTLLVILPVFLFGALSAYHSGITGFWPLFWPLFWTGYVEWFLVTGSMPNLKSTPLVDEWFGLQYQDGKFEKVLTMHEVVQKTGLSSKSMRGKHTTTAM